ncbi:hypothetical protein J1605_015958 [Eschrichtius robustus]|uniref:Basic proline-rich protein-like n=1 Tax=Eschrichtius robustus TaxID=9764 RepID=A0AB34G896_ESCRO|nr:hypothetical protein J1605_015958 [Eschrichtius robustus]
MRDRSQPESERDRQSQVARTARRVPALPAGDRRRAPRSARAAARPVVLPALEGQTFPKADPSPWTKLVARRLRRTPSAQSVHFSGEMSERKEGRGKGKGKKDRGSGKKPALAAGGQSPGECAARPGLRDPPPPSLSPPPMPPPRPRLPAPCAPGAWPCSRPSAGPGGARPPCGRPSPGRRAPPGRQHPALRVRAEAGTAPPEDPDAPRSLARPLPSAREPSPARERDPACRSGGRVRACPAPAALCTGPACPLARKAGTGLPSERLARKNGAL